MKNFLIRLILAVLVLALPHLAAHAQAADVTGGTMVISVDPAFIAGLQNEGITTSLGSSKTSAPHSMSILSGLFDLGTGKGQALTKGAFHFTASHVVYVAGLQVSLATTGPTPVGTGTVYSNGHYLGRQVIFNLAGFEPTYSLHVGAAAVEKNIVMTMSPYFANVVHTSFGIPVTNALTTGVSTLGVDIRMAPAQ